MTRINQTLKNIQTFESQKTDPGLISTWYKSHYIISEERITKLYAGRRYEDVKFKSHPATNNM